MFLLARVALATVAALLVAEATAAADANDFVIFKNNSAEDWTLVSQSVGGTLVGAGFPANLVNLPSGLKSERYTAPVRTPTSYTSTWRLADNTTCTFSSSAALNSFGNMQFHTSAFASGPRATKVQCSTVTPASNLDGSYDFNHAVAIQNYSTYLGFTGNDTGTAIAADSTGNTYLTGSTDACGPTPTIYVAKLDAAGNLVYDVCTFAGTTAAIAADSAGNAYVAGGASLAKINPMGTAFVYNVSLSPWTLNSVAVDGGGNAYVAGGIVVGGFNDVVVGKLNPTATALVYGVNFGGSVDDIGTGIAVDSAGNAYITGNTQSTNFPLVNAVQGTLHGTGDAFVAKLNAAGNALAYATYLGGNAVDVASGIAVDGNYNAYVVGTTAALAGVESFPVTTGAAQTSPGGAGDAFVAKLTSTGALGYATYLGGSGSEQGAAIAVDSTGQAYVTGLTQSTDFPARGGGTATQQSAAPLSDAYFARLNPAGNTFVYSTYLGGNSTDAGSGVAVDGALQAYVLGTTSSSNLTTTKLTYAGGQDAFIAQF
jgi:hypothetical protein